MTTTLAQDVDDQPESCPHCSVGLLFPDGRRRCFLHSTEADDDLVAQLDTRAPGIGLRRPRGRGRRAATWPGSYAWPYGPNVDVAARARMLDWAETQDLRRSVRTGSGCLRWLRTRQGCARGCWDGCWAEFRGRTDDKPPPKTLLLDATDEQMAAYRHSGIRTDKVLAANPQWLDHVERAARLRAERDPRTIDAISWLDHVTAWTREGFPAVLVAQPYALSGASVETLSGLDADPQLRVEVRPNGGWYGHGTTLITVWRNE